MKKPLSFSFLLFLLVLFNCTACGESDDTLNMQSRVQSQLDKGSKLWSEKKLNLAETEFRDAIKKHPKSAKARARLAGFLLTQNKTADAIPAYQEAITLDPENPKLFAALSIAYLHQSKYGMAKAMADQALQLDPELKQAQKLNEYIEKKQQVLEQANRVSADTSKPDDAVHNSVANKHK